MDTTTFDTLSGDGFTVTPDGARVIFRGTVAIRDPGRVVGGYLRSIHESAVSQRVPEVTVELGELKFMNSSGLRVFLDWVENIRASAHRYRLRLRISRNLSWQRASFPVIGSLAPDFVTIEEG